MYKYGVYGEIGADIINGVSRASTVAVYFGTAPVNLLQDYSGKVNEPIRISNMNEARQLLGGQFSSSDKWTKYTLCEAIEAHFNNRIGNVGPIYVINVLDPATHQGEEETVQLTFANKKATVTADDIIISTFAIEGKVLGTDYTLSYDTGKGVLTVTDIGTTPMTSIQASYTPVDFDSIDADVVIGGKDTSGATTGIAALGKVYRKYNAVPTYLAAPGWTETPAVYNALVSASQLINDHWYAFVFADIPVTADTIDEAIEWKATNDYTSGASKVFWPKAEDNGTVYHLSTLALVEKMRVDISHNNVPFETCANKSIPASGLYISAGSAVVGFDRPDANLLAAAGITTGIFWEGDWRIWGDHTAAFVDGGSYQAREIFDTNMLMLYYIVNSFQRDWGSTIDQPMTVALRDTILNREQAKLDALVAVGALIGSPTDEVVDGSTSAEGTDRLLAGFEWQIATTVTPPLKSATMTVSYTDAGYAVLYGEEGGEE